MRRLPSLMSSLVWIVRFKRKERVVYRMPTGTTQRPKIGKKSRIVERKVNFPDLDFIHISFCISNLDMYTLIWFINRNPLLTNVV